ncbi:hypothetical protein HF086_003463 [Spodoptera exigua]|uniref:Uncharacterized protein n=1 Tax=Spodoptera exigua TaxID=7107 RepID=A0A922MHR9_SPOEX|nr:hypothetical protein HF086_003463 [Spodoptera exigua]
MSSAGRGLFHGYLDTRVPKDGRIKKAGYCAMRSKRVRIPFSKFVLGSKGRIQDKQTRFRFDRVTHFGLEFDPTHNEEFAYEMYKTDKYIVGV